MLNKNYLINNIEEDDEVIKPPYYILTYVDDWNLTHMAMIKDLTYLEYLKNRYREIDCQYVEENV